MTALQFKKQQGAEGNTLDSECFSDICFGLRGADFDDFGSNLQHQVERMDSQCLPQREPSFLMD